MDDDGFFVGMVVGVVIMLGIALLCFVGDNSDDVSTRDLGQILCEEHGLDYDYMTWMKDDAGNTIRVPVIHCKSPGAKQAVALVDGVVVKDLN